MFITDHLLINFTINRVQKEKLALQDKVIQDLLERKEKEVTKDKGVKLELEVKTCFIFLRYQRVPRHL